MQIVGWDFVHNKQHPLVALRLQSSIVPALGRCEAIFLKLGQNVPNNLIIVIIITIYYLH